jgi:tRNA-Thr(GGU) m(6)t(6)A37 methyltransferase TsaA
MEIKLTPIATVRNTRTTPTDDFWGGTISGIVLADHLPENAFEGIGSFSHLEIIYYFDQVTDTDIVLSGHPRGNRNYPLMGIFAQRKKDRPNKLGLTTVELLEHVGREIKVRYLDAIDGTPVIDIKPVFREFMPQTSIRQPGWTQHLMQDYWR